MEQWVNTIAGYVWGNALVVLALAVGLYFTILTRGVQFRCLGESIRLLGEKRESAEGVSSFQAFSWLCLAAWAWAILPAWPRRLPQAAQALYCG